MNIKYEFLFINSRYIKLFIYKYQFILLFHKLVNMSHVDISEPESLSTSIPTVQGGLTLTPELAYKVLIDNLTATCHSFPENLLSDELKQGWDANIQNETEFGSKIDTCFKILHTFLTKKCKDIQVCESDTKLESFAKSTLHVDIYAALYCYFYMTYKYKRLDPSLHPAIWEKGPCLWTIINMYHLSYLKLISATNSSAKIV